MRFIPTKIHGVLDYLMGLLLIVNVVSLGLQATGARRVAATPERRPEIEAGVMTATYRSALALGLLCLLAAPVLSWGLGLDDWLAAAADQSGQQVTDVLLQNGMSEGLRDWDLWGPLIFCLLLSLFLSRGAKADQKDLVFSGIFAMVWIGEAVVTLQIKLLGGNMYVGPYLPHYPHLQPTDQFPVPSSSPSRSSGTRFSLSSLLQSSAQSAYR